MSKKKQLTFAEMQQNMQEMAQAMKDAKEGIAMSIASSIVTDETAILLGDLSVSDLKKLGRLIANDVPQYIARVRASHTQKKAVQIAPGVQTEQAPKGSSGFSFSAAGKVNDYVGEEEDSF